MDFSTCFAAFKVWKNQMPDGLVVITVIIVREAEFVFEVFMALL